MESFFVLGEPPLSKSHAQLIITFQKYSSEGVMDVWNIRKALKALEIEPNEDRLFKLTHDKIGSRDGVIDFTEFMQVIEAHNKYEYSTPKIANVDDETRKLFYAKSNSVVSAFVALGGNEDRSGTILTDKLSSAFDEMGIPFHSFLKTIDAQKVS
jgi:Ca2+-binding EF-hand superfamily protein